MIAEHTQAIANAPSVRNITQVARMREMVEGSIHLTSLLAAGVAGNLEHTISSRHQLVSGAVRGSYKVQRKTTSPHRRHRKVFLQIEIAEADRDAGRLLWLKYPQDPKS